MLPELLTPPSSHRSLKTTCSSREGCTSPHAPFCSQYLCWKKQTACYTSVYNEWGELQQCGGLEPKIIPTFHWIKRALSTFRPWVIDWDTPTKIWSIEKHEYRFIDKDTPRSNPWNLPRHNWELTLSHVVALRWQMCPYLEHLNSCILIKKVWNPPGGTVA